MENEQKHAVIDYYNAAVHRQCESETGMDSATTDKTFNRHGSRHSFALGEQAAIDYTLKILGYALVVNDEDMATDIVLLENMGLNSGYARR